MLNEPTEEKLRVMKLNGMLTAWTEQHTSSALTEMSFDERFGLLVDAEALHRDNKRLKRSLDEAKLKIRQACVEGIDFSAKRRLDKSIVSQLAICRWIVETQHVTITGATGTGKSYVACALAHQACRKGYRALYRRMPRLFQEIRLARADGTHPRLMARFARMNVLVIDDFGIAPLTDQDRQDLLELLDDRYDAASVIIAGQLPPDSWHEYIGDPTLADAICDRILHRAHRLSLHGPSRRKDNPPNS
jgi:DNA replication protein DnaC